MKKFKAVSNGGFVFTFEASNMAWAKAHVVTFLASGMDWKVSEVKPKTKGESK